MKDAKNIYNLIEQYLANEMSKGEKADFERKMAEDPELKEEVALHMELEETIKEEEVIDFSQLLNQVDQNYFAKSETETSIRPLFQRYRYISLAAAVVAIIGLYFLFQTKQPLTPEELFAANYEPQTMRMTVRGNGEDNTADLENKAKEAYQNGNYQEAIKYLGELEKIDPAKIDYSFYKGIAYLGLHQSDEAIAIFDIIIAQPDQSSFVPTAQWYRSLAFLDKADIPQAREAFQALADDPQHFYRERAQNILKSLKKL